LYSLSHGLLVPTGELETTTERLDDCIERIKTGKILTIGIVIGGVLLQLG
jgi:hypothetical protein